MGLLNTLRGYKSAWVLSVLVVGSCLIRGLAVVLWLVGLEYRAWVQQVLFLIFLIGVFVLVICMLMDSWSSKRLSRGGKVGVTVVIALACLPLMVVTVVVLLFILSGSGYGYENGMEETFHEVYDDNRYSHTETTYYKVIEPFLRERQPIKREKFYP